MRRFPGRVSGLDGLWDFLAAGESGVREVPRTGGPDSPTVRPTTPRSSPRLPAGVASSMTSRPSTRSSSRSRRGGRQDGSPAAAAAGGHTGGSRRRRDPADALAETRTGVFTGACSAEYWQIATADLLAVDAWSATGGALSIIANRVSPRVRSRGPSATVDTACSSSLAAVHMACRESAFGESGTLRWRRGQRGVDLAPTRGLMWPKCYRDRAAVMRLDAAAGRFRAQ